jgi:hypothetical protein
VVIDEHAARVVTDGLYYRAIAGEYAVAAAAVDDDDGDSDSTLVLTTAVVTAAVATDGSSSSSSRSGGGSRRRRRRRRRRRYFIGDQQATAVTRRGEMLIAQYLATAARVNLVKKYQPTSTSTTSRQREGRRTVTHPVPGARTSVPQLPLRRSASPPGRGPLHVVPCCSRCETCETHGT